MNTVILEEIGFSKGEIKVYFALLEIGQSTIGPLSKKSEITPSKVYPIITKLTRKGLASEIIKSGTKYFDASNPKAIIDYLNEKNKKITEEKEEIRKLIPIIEAKRKLSEDTPQAKVYQTFDGIRTLYNEILETLKENKEDFRAFTLGEEEYKNKESEYFFQEYDTKRRALKIKTKLIANLSQKKFINQITKHDKNILVRYLNYQMPTGVIIFGDKVATLIWKDIPTAFVIQSKETSKSYKKFFEDMWKIGKK